MSTFVLGDCLTTGVQNAGEMLVAGPALCLHQVSGRSAGMGAEGGGCCVGDSQQGGTMPEQYLVAAATAAPLF